MEKRNHRPAALRQRKKALLPLHALPIPSILQILVECKDEGQQRDLFERLKEEGYSCRVLTL